MSLLVDSRQELDAWPTHLDRCGVEHTAIADEEYGSVLVFRDPDNIQLELFVNPRMLTPERDLEATMAPVSLSTVRALQPVPAGAYPIPTSRRMGSRAK